MEKFKRIYVEITNRCNFRCSFCIDTKREKKEMSLEEFATVLEKIHTHTESIFLHVKGEPLLHSKFAEILSLCEEKNITVNVTTNGFFLAEKKETLANAKCVRQINISVHSIEENKYNKVSKEEYLEKVVTAAKYLGEKGKIISYRLWNLEEILDAGKDQDILDALAKAYNMQNILENIQKEHYIRLAKSTFVNLDTKFVWPSLQNEIVATQGSCYGLRTQIAILVDGTVVPCCLDNDGDIPLGNILKQDLEEIVESKKAKEIRQGFLDGKLVHPLCMRCGFRENKRR